MMRLKVLPFFGLNQDRVIIVMFMVNSTIMITAKNIIIPIPARLGDALFCTPAIHLLKKHRPDVRLNIIALSNLSASIFQNNPVIDNIHVQPDSNTIQQLAKNYDLAINIHANDDAQQLTSALGIKALYIDPPDQTIPQAEQALIFMQKHLDCVIEDADRHYQLFPRTGDFDKINKLLNQDVSTKIFIGLHLGCHSISKRETWKIWKKPAHPKVWPLEKFIQLAKQLQQFNSRICFVVTGSKGEETLAETFCKKIPNSINLVNQTSVLEMAALMQQLKAFICCDTGPLHVACATHVNLIALFGPTNLRRTGPYPLNNHRHIIQKPTLQEIDVRSVYQAVQNLL
jgi:ADP-heptose:LPS heptosyltransferase